MGLAGGIMLEPSPNSLGALQSQADERFIKGIADSLAENLPAEARAMARADLEMLVRRTLARALGWGIDDDEEIGKLCAIALGFGEAMLDDPAVSEFLSSNEVEPWRRVSVLLAELE